MRPLLAALFVALTLGCAPSEQPSADTATLPAATVPAGAATDSAGSTAATPLPAPPESASSTRTPAPAPSGTAGTRGTRGTRGTPRAGTAPVARGSAADTTTGPRLRPPSKAPGGYIVVPNSAHDSLRMAPPAPGTSTRP